MNELKEAYERGLRKAAEIAVKVAKGNPIAPKVNPAEARLKTYKAPEPKLPVAKFPEKGAVKKAGESGYTGPVKILEDLSSRDTARIGEAVSAGGKILAGGSIGGLAGLALSHIGERGNNRSWRQRFLYALGGTAAGLGLGAALSSGNIHSIVSDIKMRMALANIEHDIKQRASQNRIRWFR